jgi:hypothetical protein
LGIDKGREYCIEIIEKNYKIAEIRGKRRQGEK